MKVYRTFWVLGMVCLGLWSTTTAAQTKQKTDLSAAMPTKVGLQDIDKLHYNFAIEVENQLYGGYSFLSINPKSFATIKVEEGLFSVGTTTYEKKIILPLKEGHKSNLVVLEQWAKQNISYKGKLIFMIDGVVLNTQPNLVLLDQNYIVDYAVVPLDQLDLKEVTAVVQLRMKSEANFKTMSAAKKRKRE
ncbi:hypothetical protein [Myroides sp. TSA_177.3]|uniref:hypothetical protein n=1 Tax=Myroides sp. TSA_177.3 TaxID=3415650 RepID=UPI0040458A0E